MKTSFVLSFLFCLGVFISGTAFAEDPDMLQDLCVADLASAVKVNGFVCKDKVAATDFFFDGLAKPGNTNNKQGSVGTTANVQQIPGLNTLGVSMARIDYAPGGLNPPHTHPRATEIVFVLEGQLDVGFITTANVLIAKTIMKGEVFAFPRGLLHFQKNSGAGPASVIVGFNSQLPGTQKVAAALFTTSPGVPDDVLAKAFQIGASDVQKIKMNLA
ncbi:Nectarin-1 [Acorus gramineus]|uniref:Germin-like protein n=1 Tax=Acorus gramineus TaxID=55184 RepID=A0AAV9BLX6_ACOGR|nr:Nectarin-1 [Acorus gramineus]